MTPTPTHATLATFTIDLDREHEQLAILSNVIVPGVRSAPGFVAGTWTVDRSTSDSYVMITFDSAEAAEAMATSIRGNAGNQRSAGLELVSVRVLDVQAFA